MIYKITLFNVREVMILNFIIKQDFEPMSIYAPEGTKVKFMNENGFDREKEYANKILDKNQIYTVDRVEVGGWVSYVYLKEFPNEAFNTVMFKEV